LILGNAAPRPRGPFIKRDAPLVQFMGIAVPNPQDISVVLFIIGSEPRSVEEYCKVEHEIGFSLLALSKRMRTEISS